MCMKTDDRDNSQWRASQRTEWRHLNYGSKLQHFACPSPTRPSWKCATTARIRAPEELFLSWTLRRSIWTITVFQTEWKQKDHRGLQGTLGWSSASFPSAYTCYCLGIRVPANTEFRKRRGIEPRVLQSHDGRKAHKALPHIYIDFSTQTRKHYICKEN